MSSKLFWAYNGAMPTTAGAVKVTSGTAVKTMAQLSPPTNGALEIIEWGISFDGSSAATPGLCELLETGSIAGTVTAYAAADIVKVSVPQGDASRITLGTANSGFTSSAEGSIVATRPLDVQQLPPTAPYIKQLPLERGNVFQAGNFGRMRLTFGTAINVICYWIWQE